jgi:flagellar L-ring protein precursor FlgH
MNTRFSSIAIIAAGLALAGCAVTPPSIVQTPTSARPQAPAVAPVANGSIYQVASYRPMFEDRRARHVGDILTMTISESTSATKASDISGSKTGSTASSVGSLFAVPASTVAKLGASASSANKFEEKGATSSSNTFTGTVGVTVVEVLPNGNLVVSGEKQVAFDKGTEFIRISGVVNPDLIGVGNTISSTQVADARIEYRTNSHIDHAEVMGILSRFFMSFIPL